MIDTDALATAISESLLSQRLLQMETSARHVHLKAADFVALFGEGAVPTPKRPLSQPGQFLSEQRVALVGARGKLESVAILGPLRKETQVELAFSEARKLGIDPPIRESGDLRGAAPLRIEGPKGGIDLPSCAIVAQRHIHMRPEQARALGVRDKQRVSVRTLTDRPTVLEDVLVRVSEQFALRVHVDVDEANAAHIAGFTLGQIL